MKSPRSFKFDSLVGVLTVFGALLPLASAVANDFDIQKERRFIELDDARSLCETPARLAGLKGFPIDDRKAQSLVRAPDQGTCQTIQDDFLRAVDDARSQAGLVRGSHFPLYSELLRAHSEGRPAMALQWPGASPEVLASKRGFVDSWALEFGLRDLLSGPQPSCHAEDVAPFLRGRTLEQVRYDDGFWHELLLVKGYDCVARMYIEDSASLNRARLGGFSNARGVDPQSRLEELLKGYSKLASDGRPLPDFPAGAFADTSVIMIPQLGYDLPPESPLQALKYLAGFDPSVESRSEKLIASDLRAFFKARRVPFYFLERISTADIAEQVAQTKKGLDRVLSLEHNRNGESKRRYLILTRSMGGLVWRKLISENPHYAPLIRGVLLSGSTPWGSVVAKYKSRGDLFLVDVAPRGFQNLIAQRIAEAVPPLRAGLVRTNIESMSYRNFIPKSDAQFSFPVLNLIFLRPRGGDYFATLGPRVPKVDETFLNMIMEGPTEGSSPLTRASWDTSRSLRLFDHRFNHLGFWMMTPQEGQAFYLALIQTAVELGI